MTIKVTDQDTASSAADIGDESEPLRTGALLSPGVQDDVGRDREFHGFQGWDAEGPVRGKYAAVLPGLSNYCVTSDGEGFLMVKPVGPLPPTRLEVVLNWVEDLKRLRSAVTPR